jgi:hypothetical protein
MVKIYVDPSSTTSVKVWKADLAEPVDWLDTMTTTNGSSIADAQLILDFYGRRDSSLWVDYIDFDYSGKPCYQDCAGTFDDFTRTVVSGWGNSLAGYAWTTSGSGSLLPDVNNGHSYGGMIYGGGSSSSGQKLTVTGNVPMFSGSGGIVRASVYVRSTNVGSSPGYGFEMDLGSYGGYGHINFIPKPDGTMDVGVGDEMGTTWAYSQNVGWAVSTYALMNILWQCDASANRVKIWRDGTTEPNWLATRAVHTPGSTYTSEFSIRVVAQYTNLTLGFKSLDFDYDGKCTPVTGYTAAYVIYGNAEYTFTPSTATTMFYLPTRFESGSTTVYLDGVSMRRGIDYTEYPSLGEIVLTWPANGGSELYVKYVADGSL